MWTRILYFLSVIFYSFTYDKKNNNKRRDTLEYTQKTRNSPQNPTSITLLDSDIRQIPKGLP